MKRDTLKNLNRPARKAGPVDAGATLLEAFRRAYPEVVAAGSVVVPPLVRHLGSLGRTCLVDMLEQVGHLATAAKAGDMRACARAFKALEKIARDGNTLLGAELERLQVTPEELQNAFFGVLLGMPIPGPAAVTIARPRHPFNFS
jgi:hypothetical protein